MKKEEKSLLFKQKVDEGKTEDIAEYEIQRDIDFIRQIKLQRKQLEKEYAELQDKNKKLNNKFKEDFYKLTHNTDKVPVKIPTSHNANTRHLTRIIHIVNSSEEPLCQTKIKEMCLLNNEQTKNALLFLTKNKLIDKLKDNLYGSRLGKFK